MLYFFQRIQNVEPSIWMNILFLMISWQVRKIIFLIKLTFGNKSLSNFVLFVLAQSDIKLLKNIHYCRQNNSIRAFLIFLVMLFYFLLQHIQKFLPFLRTFVIIWDTITHIQQNLDCLLFFLFSMMYANLTKTNRNSWTTFDLAFSWCWFCCFVFLSKIEAFFWIQNITHSFSHVSVWNFSILVIIKMIKNLSKLLFIHNKTPSLQSIFKVVGINISSFFLTNILKCLFQCCPLQRKFDHDFPYQNIKIWAVIFIAFLTI